MSYEYQKRSPAFVLACVIGAAICGVLLYLAIGCVEIGMG